MSDSDSSDYLVAQAQSLVDTFNALSSPTVDDVNTLISGIAGLLNTSGITSDEVSQITSILTTVLQTNETLENIYGFSEIESNQMSASMNIKFLTVAQNIFMSTPALLSSVNGAISDYMDATTTISSGDYDDLWDNISQILSDGGESDDTIATMKTQYYATLSMYFHINYSNLMTATVDSDILAVWVSDFFVSLMTTYNIDTMFPQASQNILNFFVDNASDSDNGLMTVEFIVACQDTLAYLSAYLTVEDIATIKSSMETFISENYYTSDTYGDTMYLSTATTLTSSVSTKFGISAIPLTPQVAESFVMLSMSTYLLYPFSADQRNSIDNAVQEYFNGINYSENGLTATEVGNAWDVIKDTATPFISAIGDMTTGEILIIMQTQYTNIVQSAVAQNLSNVLGSTALVSDIWQEFLFTNPSTGELSFTGDYLKDWATSFVTALMPDIGVTDGVLLAFGLEEMLSSNNNLTNGVSGQNFLQIGNEILLFISNFIDQTKLDTVASDLTDFLVTFVYVSNYVATVDEALIIGAIIVVAIILVVGTILSAGLLAAADVAAVGAAAAAIVSGEIAGDAAATAAAVATTGTVIFGLSGVVTIGVAGVITTTTTLIIWGTAAFIMGAGMGAAAYGIDVVVDDSDTSTTS